MRGMVRLGWADERDSAALAPPPTRDGGADRIALMLRKREVCEPLSVRCFARSHELTLAETRVLECLCSVAAPSEIARALAVLVCTVRTHISAIRVKTGLTQHAGPAAQADGADADSGGDAGVRYSAIARES